MHDVCVIGCGRVGLPLALALKKSGLDVVGCDTNSHISDLINMGKMPFEEKGCQELLEKIGLEVRYNPEDAKAYIITVGTPLMQHIETDLSYIKSVINLLVQRDQIKNRMIILRSTVAPQTTMHIRDYIHQKTKLVVGRDFYLAMCPERLVEGDALNELHRLPQIIGAFDSDSYQLADEIFRRLDVDILYTSTIEAELSKLLCNIYRYINFSIPNYFAYLCNKFGADVYQVFNTMNFKYPRNAGLKNPGFSAGTCVKGDRLIKIYYTKNKQFIEEYISYEKLYSTLDVLGNVFVDSFDSQIKIVEKKQIKDCGKRTFTGKMYVFEFDDGTTFECTEDHVIPTIKNEIIQLKKAQQITTEDIVFKFF